MLSQRRPNSLIPVRIGALLTSANLVKPEIMAQIIGTARQRQQQVGEILIAENHITENELSCALELQRLIKAGTLGIEQGTRALRLVRQQGRPVNQALHEVGYTQSNAVEINELAQLLLDARLITKEQVQQASWNCAKNYLPLGRNLMLSGAVSPSVLTSALNALVLIRDGKVSRPIAIEAIATVSAMKISLEEALELPDNACGNHVRLGELLTAAGIISESDASNAVENALLNGCTIGQVLLESQLLTALVLDSALKAQGLIDEGRLGKQQAAELLRQVLEKQISLDDFLSEISYMKQRVLEILIDSGLISDRDVIAALEKCPQYEEDFTRALMAAEILSQELFRTTLRCAYLINEGSLTQDEAVGFLVENYPRAAAPEFDQTTFAQDSFAQDAFVQAS
jgi:hypothetical protein